MSDEDLKIFEMVESTLSFKETASNLGLTEGRVRHRFFRASFELEERSRIVFEKMK